jgi:hypothetical protein
MANKLLQHVDNAGLGQPPVPRRRRGPSSSGDLGGRPDGARSQPDTEAYQDMTRRAGDLAFKQAMLAAIRAGRVVDTNGKRICLGVVKSPGTKKPRFVRRRLARSVVF